MGGEEVWDREGRDTWRTLETKDDEYSTIITRHENEKADLQQKYDELAAKYEEKLLALLVGQANLYDSKMSARNQVSGMLTKISTLRNQHKMGDDKIKAILGRHKDKMRTMIADTLNEGWTTWS